MLKRLRNKDRVSTMIKWNVIIDLRRLKKFPQDKYINEVEQRFESITRLKHIKIIAKGRKMIEKEK